MTLINDFKSLVFPDAVANSWTQDWQDTSLFWVLESNQSSCQIKTLHVYRNRILYAHVDYILWGHDEYFGDSI